MSKYNLLQFILHVLLPNMWQEQICPSVGKDAKYLTCICGYVCAKNEVNGSNHATRRTVHIFDIYHGTNIPVEVLLGSKQMEYFLLTRQAFIGLTA